MDEKIDLLIPALNEEKNIAKILNEVSEQSIYQKIKNIFVISDNSTDNTNKIVSEISKKNKKIKLIIKKIRKGKVDSLNMGFYLSNANILITLDADVHLNQKYALEELVKPFYKNPKIGLTVLKNTPIIRKRTITSRGSLFSIYLRYEIIKLTSNKYNSFYSVCGRALAMAKKAYKSTRVLNDPGDDQELFFQTIKNGFLTYYVEKASVGYKVPLNLKDYIKQNIRFKKGVNFKKSYYDKLVQKYTDIGLKKYLAFLITFIKHPIAGICWIPIYSFGILATKMDKKFNTGAWEMSESTK